MQPFFIFDLDGTLADITHRRCILENKDDPQRWRSFYAACDKDSPNEPIIRLMRTLALTHDIRIWSGRSDEVKEKTIEWLAEFTHLTPYTADDVLTMRRAGDYTPDDRLKKEWLDALNADERKALQGCFDDRDRIVKMYRENGVTCYQVADGDF